MDNRAVLNVGARTNTDGVHIAAQHAIVPDARLWPDFHVPDDTAAGRHKSRRVNPGVCPFSEMMLTPSIPLSRCCR